MHVNGGFAYTHPLPFMNAVATFSTDVFIGEREKPRFGVDVLYKNNLSLRVGLNQGLFATGAGFNWEKKVDINYSLGINTALGPQHRLSFGLDIDNILNPPSTLEEKK